MASIAYDIYKGAAQSLGDLVSCAFVVHSLVVLAFPVQFLATARRGLCRCHRGPDAFWFRGAARALARDTGYVAELAHAKRRAVLNLLERGVRGLDLLVKNCSVNSHLGNTRSQYRTTDFPLAPIS